MAELSDIDGLKNVIRRLSYWDLKTVVEQIESQVNFHDPKVHGLADALAKWAEGGEEDVSTEGGG